MVLLWVYISVLVLLLIGLGVGTYYYLRSLRRDATVTESFEPSPKSRQVSDAFREAHGRIPTQQEYDTILAADIKMDGDVFDYKELLKFVNVVVKKKDEEAKKESVSHAIDAAFMSFEKALEATVQNPTDENKKTLAMTYSTLFCLSIETQTIRDFYLYMESKYKDKMMLVMECARNHPDMMKKCNRSAVNAIDAQALSSGDACEVFCGANFDSIYAIMDKAEVAGCIGKCALLTKVQSATPALPNTNNLTGLAAGTSQVASSPEDAGVANVEVSFERPNACAVGAGTTLYDMRMKRELDDLKSACARSSKYINADDMGKLLPDQRWSVPQQRPPPCLTDARCEVQPVVIMSSGLQGMPYVAPTDE